MDRIPEPEYMDLPEEAEAYAIADFSDVNQAFADRLSELAADGPALALDLGTGPADIPARVKAARPDWQIVGFDASFAMLQLAQNSRAGAIWPVLGDAKRLPFSNAAFDVVFSNSIIHHITDTAPFWSELRRVARPGALVFLRDLARPEDAVAARRVVKTYSGNESMLLQEEFYRSLLAAYTPEELRDQLATAGIRGLLVQMVTDRHLDIVGRLIP